MAKTSTNPKKKLAELKTKENTGDVGAFIAAAGSDEKVKDSFALLKMFSSITRQKPMMWGSSIVGFGKYIYTSPKTGRSGEWMMTGFSPRKQNLTIYFMTGFSNYGELMKKLGKYKISGGSCLYINKLADIDMKVLKEMITASWKHMKEKYQN
ncbi:MAG TPA: DUF1801 domain-containing protein [Chitinophagaceae bacterium]|nr:DUF1801 domain-containing protein [Chitinophagaceae bacterium]HRF19114.1 DUF1801 domain-containing protein [Chitinophagaceae bacterium]